MNRYKLSIYYINFYTNNCFIFDVSGPYQTRIDAKWRFVAVSLESVNQKSIYYGFCCLSCLDCTEVDSATKKRIERRLKYALLVLLNSGS